MQSTPPADAPAPQGDLAPDDVARRAPADEDVHKAPVDEGLDDRTPPGGEDAPAGTTIVVDTAEHGRVTFKPIGTIAPAAPAFFVSVAKSGSTLLHMIVEDICRAGDARLINISDTCFAAGIRERHVPPEIMPGLPDTVPAFYYGFRLVGKLALSSAFRRGTKVVLIRDPRDALTSLYYSMLSSHTVPQSGKTADNIRFQRERASTMSIDEFIVTGNGNFIIDALREIARLAWLPNLHVYRYEDVIFRKREWIRHFCDVAGLPLDDALLDKLIEKHDVVPDEERASNHIRQVAPGNYKKHLGEESLSYIEERAKDVLRVFSYV